MNAARVTGRNERVVIWLAVAGCGVLALGCGKSEDPGGAQPSAGGAQSVGASGSSAAGSGVMQAIAGSGSGGSTSSSAGTGGATSSAGLGGSGASGEAGMGGVEPGVPAPPTSFWEFGEGTSDRPHNDEASGVGVDASENVYVGGTTQSALNGPLAGTFDSYVRKYDVSGNLLWTVQWGKRGYNYFHGITVEASGNFYVAGSTVEFSNGDKTTYYLDKYDPSGKLLRTQPTPQGATALALDTDNQLYVASHTTTPHTGSSAPVVSKFNANGEPQWATPFGTPSIETASDIAIDASGNIYVASNTLGTVDNPNTGLYDGLLYKFDAHGSLVWSQRLAIPSSTNDVAGVAVDPSGNVYVAGHTDGAMNSSNGTDGGAYFGFIRKYDASGNLLWTEQFRTSGLDVLINAVRVDTSGNPYVAGTTVLTSPPLSDYVAFVRKYDPQGAVQWTHRWSSLSFSRLRSLAIAASGNVYGVGNASDNALLVKLDAQ